MKWKKYKEGEKRFLSVVRVNYGSKYEGFYITFPEEGDYYIPLPELLKLEVEG